jgi:hypothetical protein
MTTDQEIVDASGLIGLLLVFVFGYFAALLPVVLALLDSPRPDVQEDRAALATKIASFRWLMVGLLILTVLVVMVLAPLSGNVLASLNLSGSFRTIRAGLLVMDVMLLTLIAATAVLWSRMTSRIRLLRRPKGL